MRVTVLQRRPYGLATGRRSDSRKRVTLEVTPHVLAGLLPDSQKHALALVVARTVLVRLSEVAQRDGSIDGRDDFRESDLVWRPTEDVPATYTTLGANEAGTLEGEEDLLEVRLGQSSAFRDVSDRRWPSGVGVQCQREQGPTRIVTPRRDPHAQHRRG